MAKYINIYSTEAEYTADAQNRPAVSVSLVTATNTIHYNGSQSTIGQTARETIEDIYSKITTINETIEPLAGKTVITKN